MAKNIILCSDGTGNSGGKGRGTNVWKLYKALDLHNIDRTQVSIHDDGVGSQDFVLFKMLGGAFGWGLTRNVKRLYKFLVVQFERGENGEPDDDIFLFGFSRGAHTVRIVAGMVCRCGLVDRTQCTSERELDKYIDAACDAYIKSCARAKRKLEPHGGSPLDKFQYNKPAKTKQDEHPDLVAFRNQPYVLKDIHIKFIGVWDTVDAVGVPFDELREGLDLLKRVAILDKTLHPRVHHACHALAIDDQRHTFHPVMWNEWEKESEQTIEQVWFAGAHSNVGGGYPKDEMALVSLHWMMTHACNQGVNFLEGIWKQYREEADIHSKLRDSRAGLAAYYRYMPRDIKKICNEHGIPEPKIHASVFDRIQRVTEGYAPFNLPDEFVVVEADAIEAVGFDAKLIDVNIAARGIDLNRRKLLGKVWDLVWYKRGLYFLWLITTGYMLHVVYWLSAQPAVECKGEWCLVGWVFSTLGAFLPSVFGNGLAAVRTNPFWLFIFALVFAVLVFIRGRLDRRISEVSNASWRYVFEKHRPQAIVEFGKFETWLLELAHWLRNTWLNRRLVPYIKVRILPPFALVAVIVLVGWLLWKACSVTAVTSAAPNPCTGDTRCAPTVTESLFNTNSPCFATNIRLEAGKRYRFTVEPLDKWMDSSISAGPGGFTGASGPWWLSVMVPLRRSWSEPWYMLMGSTGCNGEHQFTIGAGPTIQKIEKGGRLHVFVNDAICPICPDGIWHFYKDNQGTARVTVTPEN